MTTGKPPVVTLRLVAPLRALGLDCVAGVEYGGSPPLGSVLPCREFTPLAPGPLPSSTPATQSSPWGDCGAGCISIGVQGVPSTRRSSLCSPATASSLDLQQMISLRQSYPRSVSGKQLLVGAAGSGSVPAGLRRAVNRRAPVLRFASAFQVTARRPPGGPPLSGV